MYEEQNVFVQTCMDVCKLCNLWSPYGLRITMVVGMFYVLAQLMPVPS